MSVLGMIEFKTILTGMRGSDAMVKAAPIELLESHPIDPGKYLAAITGDVASVEAAVGAGVSAAGAENVVESFVLANLHVQVLPVLRREAAPPPMDALGAIETASVASVVKAADAACKASAVFLLKLSMALHIGGKGYTTFVGAVADVEAAVEAGKEAAEGKLLDSLVIANPYPEFYEHLKRPDDGDGG